MKLFNYVWRITNYLATRAEHRKTIKVLNQLTDHELMDIGISRCDINRMIWLDEDKTMKGRGKQ